jgi:hypothetical protein
MPRKQLTKICRPKPVRVDDPRFLGLFSCAQADFEFFASVMVLENDASTVHLNHLKADFDQQMLRRMTLLEGDVSQPNRYVALREINGSMIECWRLARQVAKFGGTVTARYREKLNVTV